MRVTRCGSGGRAQNFIGRREIVDDFGGSHERDRLRLVGANNRRSALGYGHATAGATIGLADERRGLFGRHGSALNRGRVIEYGVVARAGIFPCLLRHGEPPATETARSVNQTGDDASDFAPAGKRPRRFGREVG
jgi:hypothetical protein